MKRPSKRTVPVVGGGLIAFNAQINSLVAAEAFGGLDKPRSANSTFLAHTSVLCTHHAAMPEFTMYAKGDATRADVRA